MNGDDFCGRAQLELSRAQIGAMPKSPTGGGKSEDASVSVA